MHLWEYFTPIGEHLYAPAKYFFIVYRIMMVIAARVVNNRPSIGARATVEMADESGDGLRLWHGYDTHNGASAVL